MRLQLILSVRDTDANYSYSDIQIIVLTIIYKLF